MPNEFTLVAPCFFGTESTLSFEVRRFGAQNVKVTDGRVAFSGGADCAMGSFCPGGRQSAASAVRSEVSAPVIFPCTICPGA